MRVNCREQIANPAEPVNGQDERRKCAAVDSPARLCCSVIKRATAQDAAALCHYSERGIFHDRTRKVSRTYPAYTRCLLQDCYSPRCHRRSPEHTEPPQNHLNTPPGCVASPSISPSNLPMRQSLEVVQENDFLFHL